VLGYAPFKGGSALLPMTITIMVLMIGVTERVVGRYGPKRTLVTGMVVLAAGLGLLTFVSADGGFVTHVLPGSLVAALGMSLAYIPAMLSAMAGAKPEEMGLASGIVNSTYQVGSALGLATMTAVAATAGASDIGDVVALTDGFSAAFLGAAGISVLGAVVGARFLRTPRTPQPALNAALDADELVLTGGAS